MIIKAFCFNSFYENTYIVYVKTGEAWIFDPGCSNKDEEKEIISFIDNNNLRLKRVLLTHAHIDHILGLEFIFRHYGLRAEMHELEREVLKAGTQISIMYGIFFQSSFEIGNYIIDNQVLIFDSQNITCLLTPGHSPGSLCFYFSELNALIGGDVLFEGSIGRTDLPGGDYNTLIKSIKSRLYPFSNELVIYPGHGGITTLGQEKLNNPFLNK